MNDLQNLLKAFIDNEHVVSTLSSADITEYRILGDFISGMVEDEDYLPDTAEYERDLCLLDQLVEDGTLERDQSGRYQLSPLGRAEHLRQSLTV